jgi:hypothetical protein
MRVYHSTSYRALSGSIEVEGRWAGVQWLSLVLLALLPLVVRSPLGLGLVAVGAVGLFVFPARRRVLFDARRRVLRVEHAGFLREPSRRTIPFDELRRVVLQPAGRKGGRPLFAMFARTERGRVYLVTHAGERATAELEQQVRAVIGSGAG